MLVKFIFKYMQGFQTIGVQIVVS